MNVSDNVARYIRTGVTLLVGFLVTWLATTVHVVVGPSSQAALVALTVSVVSGAYYALARFIEKKWPAIGKYLLGAPITPAAIVTLVGDGTGTALPPAATVSSPSTAVVAPPVSPQAPGSA